jgi:phage FluMu gp28-like protein
MADGIPIVRWACSDDFKNAPEHIRKADTLDFCERELKPHLEKLDPLLPHVFGEDFARKGDLTVINVMAITRALVRRSGLIVELRNVPFDQQRDILFYIVDRLPRMSGGALDATGNGAYIAEVAAQKYGPSIIEVSLSRAWYQIEMPAYIEAFSDRTVVLPMDDDILRDHQALQYVDGIIKVPDDHSVNGADGMRRHGDSAIASALAYFVSRQDLPEYDYAAARRSPLAQMGHTGGPPLDDDDDDFARAGGINPSRSGGLW